MVPPSDTAGAATVAAVARAVLGAVFLMGAVQKLRNWSAFREVLRFLLPDGWETAGSMSAFVVTSMEFGLGFFLLAGVAAAPALSAALLLMVVFTAVLSLLVIRGYDGGCACFGESTTHGQIGLLSFVRNALVLGGAAVLLVALRSGATANLPIWALSQASLCLLVALTAAVALIYSLLDALASISDLRARALRENEP